MPAKLNLESHARWISSDAYKCALSYVRDEKKLVHIAHSSANELLMYFVCKKQMCKKEHEVKKVTTALVGQFEATLQGEIPSRVRINDFAEVARVGLSLSKVYVSPDKQAQVIPCEANPLFLMCLACPAYHARGICSHVLAATHLHFKYLNIPIESKPSSHNVRYMTAKLFGRDGKRCNHRPKNAPGGLHVDRDTHADEEDQINALRNQW